MSEYERQLVRALTECGWIAMRAPSSGSATTRDLPDVIAGQAYILNGMTGPLKTLSEAWAIELKTVSGTTAYFNTGDPDEVMKLGAFARAFGASPVLAVKFKRGGGTRTPFWLVRPTETRETDGGLEGVPESDVEVRAFAKIFPATENQDAELVMKDD